MPRKQLNLPKWSGELAKPIDIPALYSLLNDQKRFDECWNELDLAREKKMPLLAKTLGYQINEGALNDETVRLSLYRAITFRLASLVCPGFQLKLPSSKLFHRGNIGFWFVYIEKMKRDGSVKSDLQGCTDILKDTQPELARPHNKAKLRQQARTFANLISTERTSRKRRAHLR